MHQDHPNDNPSTPDCDVLVAGVVAGDPAAESALYAMLDAHLRRTVSMFMPVADQEADDVVSESITVVFDHIRRERGFTGDLVRFAITIARNRCRNIANRRKRRPETPIEPLTEWVASPGRSPLDHLLEGETDSLLQEAIDALGRICRILLRGFYFEGRPMEALRSLLGLQTVQGVYYRRTVCLKQLAEHMALRMGDGAV